MFFDAGGYLYDFDYRNHVGQPIVFLYTFYIFLFTSVVSFRVSKTVSLSLFIGLLKSLFFGIYFYFNYSSEYHFYDDIAYLVRSYNLLKDLSLLEIFGNLETPKSIIGTGHIGYWLYNLFAVKIFGYYYFSPVLVNIFLSIISSYLMYLTLVKVKFSNSFAIFFFFISLIHWDTIAWTTYLNSKEQLIQFCIVLFFYNLIKISVDQKIYIKNLIFIIFSLWIVSEVRTYVLIILISLMFFYYLSFFRVQKHYISRLVILLGLFILIPIYVYINYDSIYLGIRSSYELLIFSDINSGFSQITYGIFRYLLTPLPWQVEENYRFLIYASWLHWTFFPVFLFGLFLVLRKKNSKLIGYLFLFIILIIFYSIFVELQGPRHRYQIANIIIFLQCLAVFKVFSKRNIYQ
tara:strand:- start:10821 stop:12032 length:1212 start_codon:yes stop_codon:yes gene_type:complete